MKRYRWITALVSLLVCTSCCAVEDKSPIDSLPGNWGWEGTDECTVAPAAHRISSQGRRMHITHSPLREDGTREPRREANYTVSGRSGNVLHMAMDGEDRKDDQGALVTWDLVALDSDTYCWRRNDWPAGSCTGKVQRCRQAQSGK